MPSFAPSITLTDLVTPLRSRLRLPGSSKPMTSPESSAMRTTAAIFLMIMAALFFFANRGALLP